MGLIIRRKRHFFTRLPLLLLGIVLLSLAPLLIGLLGAWFTEWQTGEPCHEGNCSWMVLPWLTIFTLPMGGVLLLVLLVLVLRDAFRLPPAEDSL